MELKYKLIVVTSAFLTALFGEFDVPLQTLIIFMILDYLTGVIVAGIYKNSNKTESGSLSSVAGFKGIVKKGMILAIVLVAYRLDLIASTNIIRNTVITAFITNEVISINENAVLMGIDVPKSIQDVVENFKHK